MLQAGWGVWRCRALTMMDARREVSSAKGKVQGADARVRVYQGAIVLAAERRERDAIRRRVMQVMSANAYWRGASREVGHSLAKGRCLDSSPLSASLFISLFGFDLIVCRPSSSADAEDSPHCRLWASSTTGQETIFSSAP